MVPQQHQKQETHVACPTDEDVEKAKDYSGIGTFTNLHSRSKQLVTASTHVLQPRDHGHAKLGREKRSTDHTKAPVRIARSVGVRRSPRGPAER